MPADLGGIRNAALVEAAASRLGTTSDALVERIAHDADVNPQRLSQALLGGVPLVLGGEGLELLGIALDGLLELLGVGAFSALLLELSDRASELDFVVARVTAYAGMPREIVETLQRNGSEFVGTGRRSVQGFEAGALGFSFGLTLTPETEARYGLRTKLTLICDKLAEHGKGVLILVDEARTSDEMRELAVTYQHLVGEEKNIAIAMAGLPEAVSGILNDKVLTFLNRATKREIGALGLGEVESYYARAFRDLGISATSEMLSRAARMTRGFPYLVQLLGYYLSKSCANGRVGDADLEAALASSRLDMEENVFAPVLAPLSDNDRAILEAMAQDAGPSSVGDLRERLGMSNSTFQPYRARLIEAGVVESPRNGKLVFAVPYLADYLSGLDGL